MSSKNSVPTAYPPKFKFKRLKMALGFCAYCSKRSTHVWEASGEDDDGTVHSRSRYRVCTTHANEFLDASLPIASKVKVTASVSLNDLLDL
jgi:hypothetical protein